MKRASPPGGHDPFAHLHAELAAHKHGWKMPVLALAGVGVVAALAMLFIPVSQTARDFRKPSHPSAADSAAPGFEPLQWAALIPDDWDPTDNLRRVSESQSSLSDRDPKARVLFASMREVLDSAPGRPALHGRKVRIPGYVVPLEQQAEGLMEFLLVPYFGACIHTPPPPANQIIHVILRQPVPGLRAMDAVWVKGTISVARHDNAVAVSSYRMQSAAAEPYEQTGAMR
jgi:hypothetical protein